MSLMRRSGSYAASMVQAAQHLVGNLSRTDISHDDLVSLPHDVAVDRARLMSSAAPAPAQ